ncbi:hypothetical protein [Halalkalibacter urbisdiaboli]|uniref:hypothetical protein n=1 Tax=Halalkalibacter urbisdiaboli TaxID=1960589 RepID=UPI0013FE048B|nr:hypothetical protein [Halalkalibacter urbisdiaboli]
MKSFITLGIIITISALVVFVYGFIKGEFLFGPFIATVIGINFIFIAFARLKQEREEAT